jgi:hypothetical protein
MEYRDRVTLINRELVNLLSIYAAPKHLDTTAKQADAINRLAESLNKRFPNKTTEDHIHGTFERASHSLSGSHKTNSWPTSPEITKAVVAGMGQEVRETASTSRSRDAHEINADRIKRGDHVGEIWIAGRVCAELINKNLVTKGDVEPYRKLYFYQLKEIYGTEKAKEYFVKKDAEFQEAIVS